MEKERRPKVRKNPTRKMVRRKTLVKLNAFIAMSIITMKPSVHIKNLVRSLQE